MAVNNSLVQKNSDKVVEYLAGDEKIHLTPNIIRNYLVSGDAGRVTDQEVVMFLNLCKYQHLNPFLREAYLVKYGNSPATIVTGKDAFMKRAKRNPEYKGYQAGVVVLKDGELEERVGGLVLNGEQLVGGWAKVYIAGYEVPAEVTVSFEEYVGRKGNGEINSQWQGKPATMIRKVALVQALREAFPEDFAGLYSQEEMGVDGSMLSDEPVTDPQEPTSQNPDERPIESDEPLPFDEPSPGVLDD